MEVKIHILLLLHLLVSFNCYHNQIKCVNLQYFKLYQYKKNVPTTPSFDNLMSNREKFNNDIEFLFNSMQLLDNSKAPSYILCDYWSKLFTFINLNNELSVIDKKLLLNSVNLFLTQLLARTHSIQDKLQIGQQIVYLSFKLPFIMRNTDTLNLVLQVAFLGQQIDFIKQIITHISNSAIEKPHKFNKRISLNAKSLCILINGFSEDVNTSIDLNINKNNDNLDIIEKIYNLLPLIMEQSDLTTTPKEELFVHNAFLKSLFSGKISNTITISHGFDIYEKLLKDDKVDSFSLSLVLKKSLEMGDYSKCKDLWSASVEHGCIKLPHPISRSLMVKALCSRILSDNHNNKEELSINSFSSVISLIEEDVCDEAVSPFMYSLGCLGLEPSEVLLCLRLLIPLQDNKNNKNNNNNNNKNKDGGAPILSLLQGYLSESFVDKVLQTYELVYNLNYYNAYTDIPSRCINGNTKVLNVLIQAVRLKRLSKDGNDKELTKLWRFISNIIFNRLNVTQNMEIGAHRSTLIDQYTMASGIELATSMGDSSFVIEFWKKTMNMKLKVSSSVVHALLRSFGKWKNFDGSETSINVNAVEQLLIFREIIHDLTKIRRFTSIIDKRMIDEACHAALRLGSINEARSTLDLFRYRKSRNGRAPPKDEDIRYPNFSGGMLNLLMHVERDWRSSEHLLYDSDYDVRQILDWISNLLVETLPTCRDKSLATAAFASLVSLSLVRGDYQQAYKNLLLVENIEDISTTCVLHLATLASLEGSLPLLSLKRYERISMMQVIESGPTTVSQMMLDIHSDRLYRGIKFQNRITATMSDIIEFLEYIIDYGSHKSSGSNSVNVVAPIGISLLQMCFSESITNNRPLLAKNILGILERARLVLDIKDCSLDLVRDDMMIDLSDITVVRARLAQRWTAMLLGTNLRKVSSKLSINLRGKIELLQQKKMGDSEANQTIEYNK